MSYSIEAGRSGWGEHFRECQITSLDVGVSVWQQDGEMSSPGHHFKLFRVVVRNSFSDLDIHKKIYKM